MSTSKGKEQDSSTGIIGSLVDKVSSENIDTALDLVDRVLELVEQNTGSPEQEASDLASEVLHKIDSDDPARIALIGQTSSGKSSTVNSLFGEDIADIRASTDTTESVLRLEFGGGLVLYDTPGLIGDGELENITRAFIRIDQSRDLDVVEKVPYRRSRSSPRQDVKLEDLDDIAPIDSVLFVMDASRARSRPEKSALKNVYLLLSERYEERLIVAGTHLDELQSKDEEGRAELIQSSESVTQEDIILVSNESGEGFEELTQELFESLPSKTDSSVVQSALVEERKLSRLNYVLNDISKMISEIYRMKGSDKEEIKISVVAMNCIIKKHYSISEKRWQEINGDIDEIKKKLSKAGTKEREIKREPEGMWETIQSIFGKEFTKTIRDNEMIGLEGLKKFLPQTVALIAENEKNYDPKNIEKKSEAILQEKREIIKRAGVVDKNNMLSKVLSNILFRLFDIPKDKDTL